MLRVVVAFWVLFFGGCIATSAHVSAGPTLDTTGVVAVRVNAGFNFGISLSDSSAATVGLGVQGGTEAPLSITSSFAYTQFQRSMGVRAEFLTTASLIGETGTLELAPSMLFVHHQRRTESNGSEKNPFDDGSTFSGRAVSVRPHGGLQIRDGKEEGDDRQLSGVFGVDLGYEFFLIGAM